MDSILNDNVSYLDRKRPGYKAPRPVAVARVPGFNPPVVDQLQDLVLDSADFAEFLEGFCGLSASLASGEGERELECSITLLRTRATPTGSGSTPSAKALGGLLARLGQGPYEQKLQVDPTFAIQDMESWDRSPECAAALLDAGVHSMLSVPLALDGGAGAVLTFFATQPHAFTEVVARGAQQYALQARNTLRIAARLASTQQASEDLQKVLDSRTAINVAIGVIMAQQRCTQDEAFEILVRAASNRNKKLRTVATELVEALSGENIRTHFEP